MKFFGLKEHFERATATAERFTGKHMTLPILGNILMEVAENSLKISATNLEHAVEIVVPGQGSGEGKITVPAKVMASLIQSLKDDKVNLEELKGTLHIRTDSQQVKVHGMASDDFPLIPQVKQNTLFTLDGGALGMALESVLPAVSVSEFKPELNGILFKLGTGDLRLASTDTFRLAEKTLSRDRKGPESAAPFIVPHRVCQEVSRILSRGNRPVTIALGDNQVEFTMEGVRVVSRTIEGNFPEYGAIVPKEFQTSTFVERGLLLEAVRASSIFVSKLQDVTLTLSPTGIEVHSGNPEVGEYRMTVASATTGPGVAVRFNYKYLLDGLAAFHENEIFIGVNSDTSPAMLRGKSDSSLLYILMPIRTA